MKRSTKLNKRLQIPKFKSIREEALFWDKHDVGDYIHFMRPAKVRYNPSVPKEATLSLRLSPQLKRAVEAIARKNNLSTSTLVRSWVIENIQTEA